MVRRRFRAAGTPRSPSSSLPLQVSTARPPRGLATALRRHVTNHESPSYGAAPVARATATHDFTRNSLLAVQKQLVVLMGELATAVEDLPRYVMDGFNLVEPELTSKLDALVTEIESQSVSFSGWATPGGNLCSAALDVARTVCRRAERRVCELHENKQLRNQEIIVYLNRLADLLWLLARWVESEKTP